MKLFITFLISALMGMAGAQATVLSETQLNTFLARSGFDPNFTELSTYSRLSQAQLAQQIVAQAQSNTATPPAPAWVNDTVSTLQMRGSMTQEARMLYRGQQNRQTLALREWWIRGMITTPTPLRERMVLFWHNHFPSSQQKVVDSHMLWQQHQAMRQHALGDFRVLLKSVVQSPAMIEYLDASQNRVQAPNENLARELMELFTLGEGHYSEQDVKQAARALTGWAVNPNDNTFVFSTRRHDAAPKQVLGHTIDNGDDLLKLILAQPQTAQWITSKLWKEFISATPDAARVNVLAKQFYASGYDIASLMTALLSEPAMLEQVNQASLVKSPVELMVGTVRRFSIPVVDERALLQPLNAMGQVLFLHPSVKGWATGEGWINANTLLARKQAISALIHPRLNVAPMMGMQPQGTSPVLVPPSPVRPVAALTFAPETWLAQLQMPVQRSLNPTEQLALTSHVLHTAPATPLDNSLEALPALKALMSDIAYQVK
jgi:uncharacterized protein (DUF1800 family)